MKTEMRKLADVKPYPNNPRHNDDAVEAVAASIREFGFRQPIVVDPDGVIVAGHTRYKAARKLGLDYVPVHVAADLTPEQARAYRLADNQTATLSSWDAELLPVELGQLKACGFDLSFLGFGDDELAALMGPGVAAGLTDPDEVPAPPDEAATKPGDLWLLGDHRLLCGDSGKAGDVDRLLGGQPVHLVNCDPPYNVRVEPRSKNAVAAGLSSFEGKGSAAGGKARKLRARDRPLANDHVGEDEFAGLLDAWFGNLARALLPGRAFYCWGGYSNLANYPPALKAHGLYFSQAVVWVKGHPVLTRKDFMGDFEVGFYGWREGAAHQFFGPSNATDVWAVKKVSPQKMEHLTQKPVELAVRALQYSSRAGENVLDLFAGSGSTLVAAEQTGRKCFTMELDPLYADVVVDRWQRFTGKRAVHAGTGEPFPKSPPASPEPMR